MLKGFDISSAQGPNFDFAGMRAQGYDFVIIKASGGHGYRNPYLAQQVAGARAAGLIVGFYHYMFEPTSGGGDVARELANFVAAVAPFVQDDTSLWLDVEEFPATVGYAGDLASWLVAFCNGAGAAYDRSCGIYSGTWYLTATGLDKAPALRQFPFWMASWQSAPPAPQFMAPWDRLTLWQYNADGVDKDQFFGTREEFMALGKKTDTGNQPFQHAPGFLDPIADTFDWGGAGIVTYRKIRVYNDQERKFYEREWSAEGGFTPWVVTH